MKKIFYFISLLLLSISCSKPKEVELILGADPDSRIADTLAYVKKTLVEAPFGWKASLSTEYSGGYGFYMQFAENDRITMVADLNDQTSLKLKESTYRVRQIMTTTLSFDTYTYLTMLQDPNPDTYGGQAGKGMGSDVEFDYVKTHGDTLFFEGRKFLKPLTLVKGKNADKEAYLNNGFDKSRSSFINFLNANPYLNITIPSIEGKIEVVFSDESRTFSFTSVSDGEISTVEGKYNYDIGGLNFVEPIILNGISFVNAKFEKNKLVLNDSNNKQYEVSISSVPVLPITAFFGYRDTYNAIQVVGPVMPLGIISNFNTLWNNQISSYQLNGASMISMTFRLVNSQKARLEVWFRIGNFNYLADASYDYVMTGNLIKLSNYIPSVSNTNWNNGWVITAVKNYFIDAEFKLDYISSSDASVRGIGGLIKTDNPSSFFYGKLVKLSN